MKHMRNLLLTTLAACGAPPTTTGTHPPNPTGGADAGTSCEDCDAAIVTAPPDAPGAIPGAPTIAFAGSHVLDERGDKVDFATGDPVHTHLGGSVDLSNPAACPDAFLYAYLMDEAAPAYGGQMTANPLAWQVQARADAGLADAAYRVRTDDGVQLLDWTAVTGSDFTIALHRDGEHAIRPLGTRDGVLFVDVRVHDKQAQETIATACANYHPLAAPIEIAAIDREPAGNGLFQLNLPADSAVSDLIAVHAHVPAAVGQRFVQHTAESIKVAFEVTEPTGHYTKAVASHFIKTAGGTLSCGTADTYSDDPRCSVTTQITSADTSASGALTSGVWSMVVIDEATGQVASECGLAGLQAICQIPPRVVGAAPHSYRIVTSVDDVADLAPAAGAIGEFTVLGRTYTGIAPATISHCMARTSTVVGETVHFSCAFSTFAHVIALDQATLAFDPFAVQYRTGVGGVLTRPLPYAPATFVSAPLTWDSGVDVLPGQ